jgi:TM2 domain-containing membrane protein YozV
MDGKDRRDTEKFIADSKGDRQMQRKSKMLAGILGILIGGLGIHRFYLGYYAIGLAQVAVTVVFIIIGKMFGVPQVGWLWGLAEGILILTGNYITTDSKGNPLG